MPEGVRLPCEVFTSPERLPGTSPLGISTRPPWTGNFCLRPKPHAWLNAVVPLAAANAHTREDIRLPGIDGSTKRDYPAAAPSWPPTPSPGHRIQLADGPTASKHVAAGAHIKLFSSKSQVLILGADFVDLERAAQQVESRGAQCASRTADLSSPSPVRSIRAGAAGQPYERPHLTSAQQCRNHPTPPGNPDSPVPVVHRPQSHDPFVLSRGFARRLRRTSGPLCHHRACATMNRISRRYRAVSRTPDDALLRQRCL